MKRTTNFGILLIFSTVLLACSQVNPTDDIIEVPIEEEEIILDNEVKKDLIHLSKEILSSVKNENWSVFASYIHPTKGVRFSPYAYIDTNEQIVLNMNEFAISLDENHNWGTYDGSGEEINLTTNDYFKRFVYDVDFVNAEQINQDTIIGGGNSLNNLSEIYPNHHFVEFHFSGFDEQYQGMDWRSLRLVFEEYENNYFLIGIIHDQWTI